MKFNAEKETNNVINFIKDYYQKNNLKGAIIGISGGKDSGVVAALLCKALGSENVIGLTLPCHSKNTDRTDAKLISDYYNIKLYNFDLTNVFDCYKDNINNLLPNLTLDNTKDSDINLKPRLRMATLYYFAALMTNLKKQPYLVAGTSNKCELFVGYFTKGGDSVHDISPIADFTVDEVIKIGEYLNVPKEVLYKKPSDGLSNQTDEDKLGVSYKDIAQYMDNKSLLNEATQKKIESLHNKNQHKFNIPTYRRNYKKIGVYVGSFDPVHKGHIEVCNYLLNKGLDEILIVPTGDYWNKNDITNIKNRIDMLKLVENNKIIIDTTHNDIKYTNEILETLKSEYPDDELYLIIGADNIPSFHLWNNVSKLLENKIIVLNRDNINVKKYISSFKQKDNFILEDNKDINISSTMIRDLIKNEQYDELNKYLDRKVIDYILLNKLYVC